MQFLVLAHDGTDAEAPERRQRVRPQHLEGTQPLAEGGTLVLGGALLDKDGGMIGSAMLFEVEDEEAVRALVEADIYFREGVWQSFEIRPFKRSV